MSERDALLYFEPVTDDYVNVLDRNYKFLGGLIRDSKNDWVYRPGRKVDLILTQEELNELVNEIIKMKSKTPRALQD